MLLQLQLIFMGFCTIFGLLLSWINKNKEFLIFWIYLSQEFMKNDTQRGCYHRKTGFNTWKIRVIHEN